MPSGPFTPFVSHYAWRNGPQLFLLNLVQWAKANPDLSAAGVCKRGGPPAGPDVNSTTT